MYFWDEKSGMILPGMIYNYYQFFTPDIYTPIRIVIAQL